jgi:hypothetical protein
MNGLPVEVNPPRRARGPVGEITTASMIRVHYQKLVSDLQNLVL